MKIFLFSYRARDIGVWFDVMRGMVFVGILTNCAILGFSSEQLMQWLPSLFTRSTYDGDQLMALGSGRYVIQILSVYSSPWGLHLQHGCLAALMKPASTCVHNTVCFSTCMHTYRYLQVLMFDVSAGWPQNAK